MKNSIAYLRAIGLGALNGFIFGVLTQIASAIRFRLWLREIDRIAAETGVIMDDFGDQVDWWTIAFFFMFVFAIVSAFMHWLRSKPIVSRMRLWQEIGLLSVIVSIAPMLLYFYHWSRARAVVEVLFLFGLVFVVNSIFGGFLQMVSHPHTRRKNPFAIEEQANTACTGRLGLGAFLGLFLNSDSFPFPSLFLPSRR